MSVLVHDVRHALRSLRGTPPITLGALICLGLGIGATTAIFSVVDRVVFHPLAYPEPDRLVSVMERNQKKGFPSFVVSIANFQDWQAQATSFSALGAFAQATYTLTGVGDAERLPVGKGSAGFFDALGIVPLLGRTFRPDDDLEPVAVITEERWTQRFGRDAHVLGQSIMLDDTPVTVIGIMPRGFTEPYHQRYDCWVPLGFHATNVGRRDIKTTQVVGRLRPTATLEGARAELEVISAGLAQRYPATNDGWSVTVDTLGDRVFGRNRPSFLTLFGAVLLLLLIACCNVASLLLARDMGRRRELSVRMALGANASRLARQLLTETAVLLVLGLILGLVLARWALALIVPLAPPWLFITGADLNGFVLASTAALAAASGLGVGVLPAFQASRINIVDALKQVPSAAVGTIRSRRVLVVVELALSLTLLVGAGLVVRHLIDESPHHLGFDPTKKLTARFSLSQAKYADPTVKVGFYRDLLTKLRADPSVAAAAAANIVPFDGYLQYAFVSVAGEPETELARSPDVQYRAVSANYFGVMGIPLRNGRTFAEADDERAPVAAIVNEALRDRLKLPTVLGRQVSLTVWNTTGSLRGDVRRLATIVGVVGDTQESFSRGPMVYVPFLQHPMPFFNVILSPRGSAAALAGILRLRLREVDAHQPTEKVQTYDQLLGRSVAEPRFYATVLSVFAVIGLVLAAVGVYTVVSTVVAQRTREIGIRRALGAQDGQVVRLMLRDGVVLCASGLVLGLMGALASTRLLKSILVNTRPYDLLTIGASVFIFGGLTVLAIYVPARRASHVDPIIALRSE
ncbi:MAG TPA: ABC transporter permease [Vicinamibacterales bacterium]|nr:ABC transporter permease [Vicinamibacterales bacterium]